MRLSLFLAIMAGVVPAQAMASTLYTMSFTGGPDRLGVPIDFAPESGSFTYDPASGFSNFLVHYDGELFDFTAAANAPMVCSSPLHCVPSTAAQEFQALFTHNSWLNFPNGTNPLGPGGASILFLGEYNVDDISAVAPPFPYFSHSAPPAVGTFTITSAPEPSSFAMLGAAGFGFLLFATARRK